MAQKAFPSRDIPVLSKQSLLRETLVFDDEICLFLSIRFAEALPGI